MPRRTFYTRTNQLAEKTLREAIQANLEDEQRYLLLAKFLATHKGVEQAEQELLSVIRAKPKAYQLRFSLAKLYQTTKQPGEDSPKSSLEPMVPAPVASTAMWRLVQ